MKETTFFSVQPTLKVKINADFCSSFPHHQVHLRLLPVVDTVELPLTFMPIENLPLLPITQRFESLRKFVDIVVEDERRSKRPFLIYLDLSVQIVESLSSNKVRTILLLDRFLTSQEIFFRQKILADFG